MMRSNPSASMQKTYDECFLQCSTAVYFEGQNNEAEALRSWKDALNQIYTHNATRIPSNWRPKSETERALQESLRQLELQCKERVDLLEALKRSRDDAEGLPPTSSPAASGSPPPYRTAGASSDTNRNGSGWLGGGTIPPVNYGDIYRPALPQRPSMQPRRSSGPEASRLNSSQPRPSLSPGPVVRKKDSRTPSPEKKGRMLRTLRPGNREGKPSSSKVPTVGSNRPPVAAKAATLAFASTTAANLNRPSNQSSSTTLSSSQGTTPRASFERQGNGQDSERPYIQTPNHESYLPSAPFYIRARESSGSAAYAVPPPETRSNSTPSRPQITRKDLPSPSSQRTSLDLGRQRSQGQNPGLPLYRNEYPPPAPDPRGNPASSAAVRSWNDIESDRPSLVNRNQPHPQSIDDHVRKSKAAAPLETEDIGRGSVSVPHRKGRPRGDSVRADLPPTPTADADDTNSSDKESDEWKNKVKGIMKNLPRGVDEQAAQQILNEIVIKGDEVHWGDIAGLDVAKSALKETVVYPFLRPDLFMGLREPARGMLLFGPPGTGKTMLARAVATESRSTFFAISASSLTSKFLGESEKLVRALFALAKLLAPSIIFVDEIDSLLSSRSGSGEHEATRRIKTEFLIQWSDLAKAAAGREQTKEDKEKGDATRVLVLAATNLPWAIDEAARRRFVRRQYIPLPEDHVRKTQLQTLLGHQKCDVSETEMDRLVEMTDGFSGSDITALAKDAAMGPLRSLGEKLLHMTMDEIRPIRFEDFSASLMTIRPSVSRQGLKEYEDWAKEFGERGG